MDAVDGVYQRSALYLAAEMGHLEIVNLLLEAEHVESMSLVDCETASCDWNIGWLVECSFLFQARAKVHQADRRGDAVTEQGIRIKSY